MGPRLLSWRGRLVAAVLATGGAIRHRSAARVHDLLPAPAGPIDILTAGRGRSTPGRCASIAVRPCALSATSSPSTPTG